MGDTGVDGLPIRLDCGGTCVHVPPPSDSGQRPAGATGRTSPSSGRPCPTRASPRPATAKGCTPGDYRHQPSFMDDGRCGEGNGECLRPGAPDIPVDHAAPRQRPHATRRTAPRCRQATPRAEHPHPRAAPLEQPHRVGGVLMPAEHTPPIRVLRSSRSTKQRHPSPHAPASDMCGEHHAGETVARQGVPRTSTRISAQQPTGVPIGGMPGCGRAGSWSASAEPIPDLVESVAKIFLELSQADFIRTGAPLFLLTCRKRPTPAVWKYQTTSPATSSCSPNSSRKRSRLTKLPLRR